MQMKKVNFGSTGKQVPAIVMGCMRMKELTVKEAAKLVDAAMAEGVDFFDHADIYGGGVCEERFKEAAEEAKISREDMWIQSKCGIVPGVMYDFSKEHIINQQKILCKDSEQIIWILFFFTDRMRSWNQKR